ncbi:2,3-dihydro-2,3-dihydroxybenzoate dehydrogenase [Pseudomonas japonica]|uniref:2,3-dihydro-2,3-dihydroxybenzoate dehydrogenase n=1 Tax=Pseudomonas japonica TaxID=256466 RepID=UPI0015E2FEF0|nr:2,3-dihydro-2,3-dihydroxybenzoate dehydrogenase [Pseudomonas japonica]
MNTLDFAGKRVWVTGAGQGIGLHTAMRFQAAGAEVVGLDKHFAESDYPFRTVVMDVTDSQQVEQVCQQLLNERRRVDVLVNGAGILRLGNSDDLSLEDWNASMAANATGPFLLFRQLVPVFKAQRSGAIVSIASNAAHVPRLNMAGYCASKAALVALNNCVGLELAAHGVRCNLVSPGSTDTPMLRAMVGDEAGLQRLVDGLPEQYKLSIPLRKIARPDEIANTVLFLASDLASHITMQDIVVDGGATLAA